MKLWRKAAGAIKDKNSIWLASLSRRTPYRHPDLEAIIIKTTSHDDSKFDYKNARRVFEWIRTSPIYLKPLAWGLSSRMEKTRSWVVALKGLMLIHGVVCSQIPAVQRMGRLPFDLSSFRDRHSHHSETCGVDSFIRTYYAYLDQKLAFVSAEVKSLKKGHKSPLMEEMFKLQNWQSLLEMLLQVRPRDENIQLGLILEAMDNLVVEVFDVYSRICKGIAQVLLKIYASPSKAEASMALKIVQKGAVQVDDLSLYLELCRELGVLHNSQCPKMEKIPEEDIKELEQIINGTVDARREYLSGSGIEEEKMAIVVREGGNENGKDSKGVLKTIITEKWEIFDGELSTRQDPFAGSYMNVSRQNLKPDLPDLITF